MAVNLKAHRLIGAGKVQIHLLAQNLPELPKPALNPDCNEIWRCNCGRCKSALSAVVLLGNRRTVPTWDLAFAKRECV